MINRTAVNHSRQLKYAAANGSNTDLSTLLNGASCSDSLIITLLLITIGRIKTLEDEAYHNTVEAQALEVEATNITDMIKTLLNYASNNALDIHNQIEILFKIGKLEHPTTTLSLLISNIIVQGKLSSFFMMRINHASIINILIQYGHYKTLTYFYDVLRKKLASLVYPNNYIISDDENNAIITSINRLKLNGASNLSSLELKFYIDLLDSKARYPKLTIEPAEELNRTEAARELFGNLPIYSPDMQAIVEIRHAFENPEMIIPKIRFLEQNFNHYCLKKMGRLIPQLSPTTYTFLRLDAQTYPIPNDNFTGVAKNSCLQEFIMLTLRQHGHSLSNEITKWIGFVPAEKANLAVTNFEFITEGRINEGLFHGKLTHMIHLALISYILEDIQIPGASLTGILNLLINTKKHASDRAMWNVLLDSVTDRVSFQSPFWTHSLIMRYGHTLLQAPSLANYLIDSFCKGFNKLLKLKFDLDRISKQAFLTELKYKKLSRFSIPKKLLLSYIDSTNDTIIDSNESSYAIIKKTYQPDTSFIPGRYRLFEKNPQKKPAGDLPVDITDTAHKTKRFRTANE